MLITIIGWVLIPLGVVLFFIAPRWLYVLMVFFIPFSATAVVNIRTGLTGSGLQATIFFGSLWILSVLLKTIVTGRIRLNYNLRLPFVLLSMFLGIELLSLMMPILIDGKLLVHFPELSHKEAKLLMFSGRHITQALYLIYGIIVAIMVAIKNSDVKQLSSSIKIYVLSGLFVSLWGVMQLFLYTLHIPYPAFIFNNSITPSAQGFRQVLGDLAIKRISSVAVEPSILSQFLLTVIPLLFFSIIRRSPIFTARFDRFCLLLVLFVLLISTSTTAYYGLFITSIVILVMMYSLRLLQFRHLIYSMGLFLIASIALFIAIFLVPAGGVLIQNLIIEKMMTYSGQDRLQSIINAWHYFLKYPILGIGWGSIGSHDLVVKILSNSGLFGFFSFGMFVFYTLSRHLKGFSCYLYNERDSIVFLWNMAIFVSFFVLLTINLLTGFAFVFGHFWFVTGISIAVTGLLRRHSPRIQSVNGGYI